MENEKSEIQQLRKDTEADTDPRVDLAVERTELAWERTQTCMDQDNSWFYFPDNFIYQVQQW